MYRLLIYLFSMHLTMHIFYPPHSHPPHPTPRSRSLLHNQDRPGEAASGTMPSDRLHNRCRTRGSDRTHRGRFVAQSTKSGSYYGRPIR